MPQEAIILKGISQKLLGIYCTFNGHVCPALLNPPTMMFLRLILVIYFTCKIRLVKLKLKVMKAHAMLFEWKINEAGNIGVKYNVVEKFAIAKL